LSEPETVVLSVPAGRVLPGPRDERLYVIRPLGKQLPYGLATTAYGKPFIYLPPWDGPVAPPAMPDAAGHLDQVPPGTPAFELAHLYGTVRFVLDLWEHYLQRPIAWHFQRDYAQLELVLLPALDNATAGYGFMEVGSYVTSDGASLPFSLNFDVLAHEVGHFVLYHLIGLPRLESIHGEFLGFHESAADLVALISALHFDSVVEECLEASRGNLYAFNELNRFAEISEHDQIRMASNSVKLSDFAAGWTDEHDLSLPLTGAVFDMLVDMFVTGLVERGLIPPAVRPVLDRLEHAPEHADAVQAVFDQAYGGHDEVFKEALLLARDALARILTETWQRLTPDEIDFKTVGVTMLAVDRQLSASRHQDSIAECLAWRAIGDAIVGPALADPAGGSHAFSARTVVPEHRHALPRLSYRERWLAARRR
jgi:hypothetical protein